MMNWSQRYAAIDSTAPLGQPHALSPEDKADLIRMGRDLNSTPHNFTSKDTSKRPSMDASPEEWAEHLHTMGAGSDKPVTTQNEELALAQSKRYQAPRDENNKYLSDEKLTTTQITQKTIKQQQSLGNYGTFANENYGTDITNKIKGTNIKGYQGMHYLANHADSTNVPELARGIKFQNDDGSEASHEDVQKHFTIGSTMQMGASSFTSNPEFAKSWAMAPVEVQGSKLVTSSKKRIPIVFHTPSKSQAVQVSPLGATNKEWLSHRAQNEYLHSAGDFVITDHKVDEDGVHHIYLKQTKVGMPIAQNPATQQKMIEKAKDKHQRRTNPKSYEQDNPDWKQKKYINYKKLYKL